MWGESSADNEPILKGTASGGSELTEAVPINNGLVASDIRGAEQSSASLGVGAKRRLRVLRSVIFRRPYAMPVRVPIQFPALGRGSAVGGRMLFSRM